MEVDEALRIARRHLAQHPGRRDPALGTQQREHAPDIALTDKAMRRAREHTVDPIEIIARAEMIRSDQGDARHARPDARMRPQDPRAAHLSLTR